MESYSKYYFELVSFAQHYVYEIIQMCVKVADSFSLLLSYFILRISALF